MKKKTIRKIARQEAERVVNSMPAHERLNLTAHMGAGKHVADAYITFTDEGLDLTIEERLAHAKRSAALLKLLLGDVTP